MGNRGKHWILLIILSLSLGASYAHAQLNLTCQATPTLITINAPYDLICVATGGTGPYTFSLAGTVPTGLTPTVVDAEYLVQGNATATGTYSFTISVNDTASSPTAWQAFTISVVPAAGPTLTSITPNPTPSGSAVTLSVAGTGFNSSDIIFFNGAALSTVFVSPTLLTVFLQAAYAVTGSYPVYVHDSAAATNSNTSYVSFSSPNGVTLSSVSPPVIPAGSPGMALSLYGWGFTSKQTVSFGANTLNTTFISSSQLEVFVPANLLATAENVNVSVGGSNTVPLVIGAGTPLTINCVPNFGPAILLAFYQQSCLASGGNGVYTWAVRGLPPGVMQQNNSGSFLIINGNATTVQPYSYTIQVSDTAGHTGVAMYSGTINFPGNNYNLSSVTPSSVPAGSLQTNVVLIGNGFTPTSTAFFNQTALTTIYVSATQIDALIPASLLTSSGSNNITVSTAGIATNASPFTVTPVLTSLSPSSVPAGSSGFVLTLFGSGFGPGQLISFGNAFTFSGTIITSNQISAFIPASAVATAGTVIVSIVGGNSLPFVIRPAGGQPISIGCNPNAGPTSVGAPFTQTCTATGGNGNYSWAVQSLPSGIGFIANGASLNVLGTPTANQQYNYIISVSDSAGNVGTINYAGNIGPVNNSYNITEIAPNSVEVGSTSLQMIVLGNGFGPSSAVYFNGAQLSTSYVSSVQLNSVIPANLLATAGTYNVAVSTNGNLTNAIPFSVAGTAPSVVITALLPSSVPAGSASFTLTITGAGLMTGQVVNFGNLSTGSISPAPGQLTATIPAAWLTTPGTVNVSVGNSNSLPFVIGSQLGVSCSPPAGIVLAGTFFSTTCTVVGGSGPYAWTPSTVPQGMNLAPAPGGVSITMAGTPTLVGVQPITFTVQDSNVSPLRSSATVLLTVDVSMPSTKVGVFRNGTAFLEDSNGDGIYEGGVDHYIPSFTGPGGFKAGDMPVVGDWTGDGHAKVGIYRSTTGQWFLDANNNGVYDANDYTYAFGGLAGDLPFAADWSGQGKACIGIFRGGGFWMLDLNCNGVFDGAPKDTFFGFGGAPGDVPVVGAFLGGGVMHVGVVRRYTPPNGVPQGNPFVWVIDHGAANAGDSTDLHQPAGAFAFGGLDGDVYVTGDFNATGVWTAGVYRSGFWVLDAAPFGAPQSQHVPGLQFAYGGTPTDIPVTGIW